MRLEECLVILVYLIVSMMAAFAMSITAYGVTGSILLAFLTYCATGSIVLMAVFISGYLAHDEDDASQQEQRLYPAE